MITTEAKDKVAQAIVFIGKTAKQQPLIMCTNGEITGVHPKEHSFFLAEVKDDENYLIIKVHKNTLRTATEHYDECKKNGADRDVDLNLLDWNSIIHQKIWAFHEIKEDV